MLRYSGRTTDCSQFTLVQLTQNLSNPLLLEELFSRRGEEACKAQEAWLLTHAADNTSFATETAQRKTWRLLLLRALNDPYGSYSHKLLCLFLMNKLSPPEEYVQTQELTTFLPEKFVNDHEDFSTYLKVMAGEIPLNTWSHKSIRALAPNLSVNQTQEMVNLIFYDQYGIQSTRIVDFEDACKTLTALSPKLDDEIREKILSAVIPKLETLDELYLYTLIQALAPKYKQADAKPTSLDSCIRSLIGKYSNLQALIFDQNSTQKLVKALHILNALAPAVSPIEAQNIMTQLGNLLKEDSIKPLVLRSMVIYSEFVPAALLKQFLTEIYILSEAQNPKLRAPACQYVGNYIVQLLKAKDTSNDPNIAFKFLEDWLEDEDEVVFASVCEAVIKNLPYINKDTKNEIAEMIPQPNSDQIMRKLYTWTLINHLIPDLNEENLETYYKLLHAELHSPDWLKTNRLYAQLNEVLSQGTLMMIKHLSPDEANRLITPISQQNPDYKNRILSFYVKVLSNLENSSPGLRAERPENTRSRNSCRCEIL